MKQHHSSSLRACGLPERLMGPVWALLLLLPIAQGAETFCNATIDNVQCYGALGGNMNIQMMDNGLATERCHWWKNKERIFYWKNYTFNFNGMPDRSVFFSKTGIFQLRNLSYSDTDSYTLDYFENGRLIERLSHKLIIQAPVSSVNLELQCSSKGEIQVTCTAEVGDSPEFSWTLDGKNLTAAQLLSKNEEKNTVLLRQNTEGRLRCSVRNHVSEAHRDIDISICGHKFNCTVNGKHTICTESTTCAPFSFMDYLAIVVRALLISLITGILLFYVLKKKCWDKRGLKASQPRPDHELSVVYSNL